MSANKLELIQSLQVTSPTATVTLGGTEWVNTYDSYKVIICLLYTSPSPRDKRQSRMPSSA